MSYKTVNNPKIYHLIVKIRQKTKIIIEAGKSFNYGIILRCSATNCRIESSLQHRVITVKIVVKMSNMSFKSHI